MAEESEYQGGYPELVRRDYRDADLWYASYLETYLTKDIRALSQVGNNRDFRRFIQLLAANTSQTLEMTHYARDLGVSVPTIKRWISVLEASYIIYLLPPFYQNYGKRITKSPKIYFYDAGLVSYLTGIKNYELYEKGPLAGSLFENYIVMDLLKQVKHNSLHAELYFMRTHDGAEIDLIVDHKSHCDLIEIKRLKTFKPKMASSIKRFATEQDRKIVLYRGETIKTAGIEVVHYQQFLQSFVERDEA